MFMSGSPITCLSGDRMSMAASLETRPPFLDYRLVELAHQLPSNVKIRGRTTKWVIKQVAHRYLPADVVNRQKIGFKVPVDLALPAAFERLGFLSDAKQLPLFA